MSNSVSDTARDRVTPGQRVPDPPRSGGDSSESARLVGNIISLGSGEIAARAVAFVGTAYLGRLLGPAGFGVVGFAGALAGYLSLAISAGFNDYGAREVARRPQEAGAIAESVVLVRLVLACGAFLMLAACAATLEKPASVRLIVALTGLSFFSLALDTSWVYKGLERSRPVGRSLVVGQVVSVLLILLVVRAPQHVARVPIAQFLGELTAALLLTIPLFSRRWMYAGLAIGIALLRGSAFLVGTRVLRTLIFSFDVVLIGVVLGEQDVGLYTAAYRICLVVLAIAVAMQAAYLPLFARAVLRSGEDVQRIADGAIELAAVVAAPLTVGGMTLAGPLLALVFGPNYEVGAAAFRPLLLSIGFICLGGTAHNVLVASHRLRAQMWIAAAAAGGNIVLNLLLTPRYGIVAAGWITAASEALTLGAGLVVLRRAGVPLRVRPALGPIVASLVMGAAVYAVGNAHTLALPIVVGVFVYVLVLSVICGVPRDMRPHFAKISSRLQR